MVTAARQHGFLQAAAWALWGVVLAVSPLRARPPAPSVRVLLVSLDGLRRDALSPEHMPFLAGRARRGLRAADARCTPPTLTVPGHASMLSGRAPATHGRLGPGGRGEPPLEGTILLLAQGAGRSVGAYLSKEKLAFLAPKDRLSRRVVTGDRRAERAVGRLVADITRRGPWDLTFLHVKDPDAAGHRYGWMSEAYLAAVGRCDAYLEAVARVLARHGGEDTVWVVTADHGGSGRGHLEPGPETVRIPWVVFGGAPAGTGTLEQRVRLQDTAPTVLTLLGLEPPPSMEGRTIQRVVGNGSQSIFLRGDADGDGAFRLADPAALLRALFSGGRLSCEPAADANADRRLDIADAVYAMRALVLGGTPPPAPWPACGRPRGEAEAPCASACAVP